jgi:UDP-2,3-diacylglucosamine pyrophosphatase LpxH
MKYVTAVVLSVCLSVWILAGNGVRAQPGDRLLVVISDLHFGIGRDQANWNAMEDFRWAPEFQSFLDEVTRLGNGKTDLVIAGDAFELWQSRKADCAPANLDAGCSEAEALERLATIVASHGEELKALGRFAAARDNRLALVPGNHDAALLFPAVARAAVAATGGPADRVAVQASGYWVSPSGDVLIEHGHQMGREVNKLRGWPRPFVGNNPLRLERSWGEQFVQGFYNQYEAKYPIIDNVSEEGAGIAYAREVEGWVGTTSALGRFVQFYLTNLSLAQHASALGNESAPAWDLAAVRAQGPAFFIESLPSDDPLGRAIRGGSVDFASDLQNVTDDDLRAMCDARAQIFAYQQDRQMQPTVTKCRLKDGALGAVGQTLLRRSRSTIVSAHLKERFSELSKASVISRPFAIFIYGHTHLADAGFRPMSDISSDWNPTVLNTGAWQRTITPDQLATLKCRTAPNQSPIQLTPEELPACYSAVFVPSGTSPVPELRYWTAADGKRWGFDRTCRWTPPCPALP